VDDTKHFFPYFFFKTKFSKKNISNFFSENIFRRRPPPSLMSVRAGVVNQSCAKVFGGGGEPRFGSDLWSGPRSGLVEILSVTLVDNARTLMPLVVDVDHEKNIFEKKIVKKISRSLFFLRPPSVVVGDRRLKV